VLEILPPIIEKPKNFPNYLFAHLLIHL